MQAVSVGFCQAPVGNGIKVVGPFGKVEDIAERARDVVAERPISWCQYFQPESCAKGAAACYHLIPTDVGTCVRSLIGESGDLRAERRVSNEDVCLLNCISATITIVSASLAVVTCRCSTSQPVKL